jgi:hypothetical protein
MASVINSLNFLLLEAIHETVLYPSTSLQIWSLDNLKLKYFGNKQMQFIIAAMLLHHRLSL